MTPGRRDRALAALQGLALGDALGMPTQDLPRDVIAADHGAVTGLLPAGPHQRIAAGAPAGRVTDDTEQALLLADLLVEGRGRVDPGALAARLLAWEQRMRERGSLDLLGPSTKAALERLARGVPPSQAGAGGATDGAAMRITPVGIAVDASDLARFVDAVVAVSALTHGTSLGIAAAAAVGAAVSAGVGGADLPEALDVARAAAAEGARRAPWTAGGTVEARLPWAVAHLRATPPAERAAVLADVVGTSVAAQEAVVAALAVAATGAEDPWGALCLAASAGGDTDTVAAMAGAVLGATSGAARGATSGAPPWPADALATLAAANEADLHLAAALPRTADALLALRDGASR